MAKIARGFVANGMSGLRQIPDRYSGQKSVRRYFAEAGYIALPTSDQRAAATESLPPLHADPFDRILVAQALTEPLKLLTNDATVAAYSDSILLV